MERLFIKKLTSTSVKRLLKRFKDSGTMNWKEGSGQPRSVTTAENTDLIEELISWQEEAPHTHLQPFTKYLRLTLVSMWNSTPRE